MFKRAPMLPLLLISTPLVFAQQTTLTPNIGLQLPGYNSTNWQVPIYYDLQQLDSMLGGTATIPALHIAGNLQVDGAFNASGLTFSAAQILAGLTYTPLKPANNLSDLASPSASLLNLGGEPKSYIDAADQANAATAGSALSLAQNAIPVAAPVTYSSAASYGKGALAIYTDGNTYLSLQGANTNNVPSAVAPTAYWALYIPKASAGAAGSAGAVQIAGSTGALAAATPAQVLAALPYAPLNKAGDTMGGLLTLSAGSTLLGVPSESTLQGEGFTTGWNFSSGQGETDLFNNHGLGTGTGFYFYDQAPSASTPTLIAQLGIGGMAFPGAATISSASLGLPASTTIGGNAVCTSAGGAACPAAGSAVAPSGSTPGQIFGVQAAGQPAVVLTAAAQRASDGALQIIKRVEDLPTVDPTSTSSTWFTASGCAAADITGVNDSTCAFQAAITYAASVGHATNANNSVAPAIAIPYGNFKLHHLVVPNGISLIGQGMGTTLVQGDPNLPLIVKGGAYPTTLPAMGRLGRLRIRCSKILRWLGTINLLRVHCWS